MIFLKIYDFVTKIYMDPFVAYIFVTLNSIHFAAPYAATHLRDD